MLFFFHIVFHHYAIDVSNQTNLAEVRNRLTTSSLLHRNKNLLGDARAITRGMEENPIAAV
jgi:hypothetical protein